MCLQCATPLEQLGALEKTSDTSASLVPLPGGN
jgi:hypothetical protein